VKKTALVLLAIFFCCCFLNFTCAAAGQNVPMGIVIGSVRQAYLYPLLIRGAKVTFTSETGVPTTVSTDDEGKFRAQLPSEVKYAVTVEAKGLWPVHRPNFRVVPGKTLKFDFLLLLQMIIDTEGISPEERLGFNEDKINLGNSEIVVASGRRTIPIGGNTNYHSIPIGDGRLPVTISFGAYTVRADAAEFDQNTGVLRAEGSVLVEDGSGAEGERSSCVDLRVTSEEVKIKPCHAEAN